MNHFWKKAVVVFILVSSANLFAQDIDLEKKIEKSFQPKFTLGFGIYTLTGDIQNEEIGMLKGKPGFHAGMKFDLLGNLDLSFLLFKASLAANNGVEYFSSEIDGFGLNLGYNPSKFLKQSKITPILSAGVQSLGVSTTILDIKQERSNSIIAPLAIGLRMEITERLEFDVSMQFAIGMSDIDMSSNENSDGYKSLNFSVHYDLFTKDQSNRYIDDTYYANIDFSKLEAEDEDGDLISDMDDYCPNTPIGVKVDKNGCPLDDDKDGIPNYLDKQKGTPEGSIVDENGIRLTADKYKSMYSELEVATRKYANFYNEVEIKRENYKTIDEYLIAKANAFNKAFNESLDDNSKVEDLIFKVKIGEFTDGIPARIANKLLSLEDLQSFTMDDDAVIYAVGSYNNFDDAMSRLFALEDKGFDDTYILVDNNGVISNYIEPVSIPVVEELTVADSTNESINDTLEDQIINEDDEQINETTYRIQIGAFNKPLSEAVFVGVDNVISFTGKDQLVRYTTGSFIDYKDAVDYQAQMKARGFDDAFIVTYKNGERISLNVAIKKEVFVDVENKVDNSKNLNIKFTVQIMVSEVTVSASELEKMTILGNIDKESKGSDLYEYYAGTYESLADANSRLSEAKMVGFVDAFIFAKLDGERITVEKARKLLSE
tara:strand:- start:2303 stop:4279 length:1977 start_codon:yes stop_codon:yes gene_type:complete